MSPRAVAANSGLRRGGLRVRGAHRQPQDLDQPRVEIVEMLSLEETRRRVSIDFTPSGSLNGRAA